MNRHRPLLRQPIVALMVAVCTGGVFGISPAEAQKRVTKPDYAQAKQYSSRYLRQFVYSSSVRPTWIGKTDTFWYSYRTSQGTKYYLVDAKRALKDQLFDHQKLASLISEATRKPVDSHNISLSGLKVADDGKSMTFRAGSASYKYDLVAETMEKVVRKAPAKPAPKTTEKKKTDDKKVVEKKDETKKGKEKSDKSDKGKSDKKSTKETQSKDKKSKESEKSKDVKKKSSDSEKETKESDKKEVKKSTKQKVDQKKKTLQRRGRRGVRRQRTEVKKDQKKQDGKDKKVESTSSQKPKTSRTRRQAEYRSFSPDRKSYVFAKGHDLYFVRIPKNYKPPVTKKKGDPKKKASSTKKEKVVAKKKQGKDKKEQDKDKKDSDKKVEKKEKSQDKGKDKKDVKKTDDKKQDQKEGDDKKSDKDKKDDKKKVTPIPPMDPKLDAKAVRLTKDGVEDFSFAGGSSRGFFSRGRTATRPKISADAKSRPRISWSEDSKSFYVNRYDRRNVKKLFVINSLSNPRPTLEQYSYPMPGEEGIRVQHLYYFDAAKTKLVRVEQKWKHETYRNVHWNKSGDKLRFGRHDRLLRNVEFCEVNIPTGKTKCMISDGFDAAFYESRSARYLKDSDEMLWWSEKSGWGHYYLYDRDGNFKNAVTSGPFRASRIVQIDEKNRLVYFYGNGREPGENIYHQHLYRVRLDGTGLTLMDPGKGNHRSSLSPSKKFVVDNFSAVDQAPTAVLRDANGKKILDLETADLTRLEQVGWRMPETFVVKAADGVTNLYGNMWKPFNFNPKKKYPVIAHVYPGPQTEGTSHTFSATAGNQQLAQLGFIVIQVGHRGGTPQRSKAYARYGYYNLRDYGLADKKAAIEQLAQRFSYVDVKRVGIYGHSGGGFMTATALLLPPYNDFFTAGFSTAGNHDNNIYNNSWSERYHGLKVVKGSAKSTTKSSTSTTTSAAEQRRRQIEEFMRRRRGGAGPDSSFDYAAGDVTDEDYFYEHEGEIDPMADGPAAFLNQEKQKKKEEEKSKQTKKTSDNKKTDDKKKTVKKKDETRFEIKVPTTVELAENLKGHLFLVHGEADNNVHPANTLRLVDALIKKNKRFDMLYLPATRHGFGRYQPYVTQRMYEFFAEHLMDDYQDDADLSERK